ncbi:MAG: glutathione S-transferase N-terminal domain-containing protein [Gammaproteobacteria bacterium]|nr:glutathione S-transferase N-terminal domain-containing protein [Gammaproteobacteria bacterium]
MKTVIRLFFRIVRRIIGPIMLLIDWLTTPKGIQREPQEQEKIDQNTQKLALFQYKTCPFCMKVRRHTKRLSLNIETLDAQHDHANRAHLLTGGGMVKVPCLKITKDTGEDHWMYESKEIIDYLNTQFGQEHTSEQHATHH